MKQIDLPQGFFWQHSDLTCVGTFVNKEGGRIWADFTALAAVTFRPSFLPFVKLCQRCFWVQIVQFYIRHIMILSVEREWTGIPSSVFIEAKCCVRATLGPITVNRHAILRVLKTEIFWCIKITDLIRILMAFFITKSEHTYQTWAIVKIVSNSNSSGWCLSNINSNSNSWESSLAIAIAIF